MQEKNEMQPSYCVNSAHYIILLTSLHEPLPVVAAVVQCVVSAALLVSLGQFAKVFGGDWRGDWLQ